MFHVFLYKKNKTKSNHFVHRNSKKARLQVFLLYAMLTNPECSEFSSTRHCVIRNDCGMMRNCQGDAERPAEKCLTYIYSHDLLPVLCIAPMEHT